MVRQPGSIIDALAGFLEWVETVSNEEADIEIRLPWAQFVATARAIEKIDGCHPEVLKYPQSPEDVFTYMGIRLLPVPTEGEFTEGFEVSG